MPVFGIDSASFRVSQDRSLVRSFRSEIAIMPNGPHTPVTNIAVEAAPVAEQNVEEPFGGDPPNPQLITDDGRENVPRPPKLESLSTEVWQLPDTSSLPDIGIASFGQPKTIAETVHGPDDRVQITQTTKYAWRANASLLITARDGSQWIGTGWFIAPRTLATAGHCVCIKGSGIPGRDGWVKSIQVVPGRNQQSAPLGAATSTVFWSVKGWVDAGDENYDYAHRSDHPNGLGETDRMVRFWCSGRLDPQDRQRPT